MPPRVSPPKIEDGRFVDSQSGLVVPRTYKQRVNTELANLVAGGINGTGFAEGLKLRRDDETLAVRWPLKGDGYDDLVSQSIVDGTVANVGVSPVIAPQISGMVRRQQNQAATASIDLTGRTFPVKQARDAIARFNDSPLGITQALERIVYGICTYNRGAPIATVPITYAFDQWEQYGLHTVPIAETNTRGRGRKAKTERYYLEVDWAKHGTPVPFLPLIYDLEPSGVPNWPYWYRVKKDGLHVWVLLHHTHIIEFTPGTTSKAGIGTSPVWMCLGFLAEQILVIEERAEKMLYSLTDGLILLGGVEAVDGASIKNSVVEARKESIERGMLVGKGQTILTSPTADKVSVATVSFRQPPGMEFQAWREYTEDVIAFCFGEALSALVTRGGVGYGAQSDTAADNSAESGVGAILNMVALALGAIYPRVQVSVSRPNDRAQRLNIKTLTEFSTGATALIDRNVLSADETRSIINRDILAIPQTGIDTVVATANADDSTDEVDGKADDAEAHTEERETTTAARGSSKVQAQSRFSPRRFKDDMLYEDDAVTITDADVERALQQARTRIDPDLYDLLTAEPVEE